MNKKKVLSLDLKTVKESLIKTVCGIEFQTDVAENWKAHLEKRIRDASLKPGSSSIICFCKASSSQAQAPTLTGHYQINSLVILRHLCEREQHEVECPEIEPANSYMRVQCSNRYIAIISSYITLRIFNVA